MNFKLHDTITLNITGLGSSGEGVGKKDNFTVFVPGALSGEEVLAKVTLLKKSYAQARLIKVLTASPERTAAKCKHFALCGGCQLQHLSYAGQLAAKEQQVKDSMQRLGGFADVKVLPILGSEQPWHYRNKMLCPLQADGDMIKAGFYAKGSHRVIDIDSCVIQDKLNNTILHIVRDWLNKYKISVYDEASGRGLVRHILGRVSSHNGEVMVGLVTTKESVKYIDKLITMLKENIPTLAGVVQNINTKRNNVILGDVTKLLYGKECITDCIGKFTFDISARSFFQVNNRQTELLYSAALNFADLSGTENVLDLYCGIGTISLFLAKKAQKVCGVEVVDVAINDARANAMANGVKNVEFVCEDATVAIDKLTKTESIDVIVLDPPRAGCDKELLHKMRQAKVSKIVYVSCNPASLARDCKILCEGGEYELVCVQPVDMFSQTSHVETCVLLSRKNS